jgi:Fatty acid desaturase
MAAAAAIKLNKRSIIDDFCTPRNWIGGVQVLTTLLPMAAIWAAIALIQPLQPPAFALAVACISLLLLRTFSLMHDCGHNSLFRSPVLNRLFGFMFGLLTGMPQFVWAQHHNYHHAHNGNWAKYRGPLAILTVDEFRLLSPRKQRLYAATRTLWLAPLAGFLYLIVNPRLNWLRGTGGLLMRLGARAIHRPKGAATEQADVFQSRFWASRTEYWHMTANNLALFVLWAAACWAIGAATFFPIYLLSVSLAGGAGSSCFQRNTISSTPTPAATRTGITTRLPSAAPAISPFPRG